jgi:soluble lytic murein transglycosylase-like protein
MNGYIIALGVASLAIVTLISGPGQAKDFQKIIKKFNNNQYVDEIAIAVERFSKEFSVSPYLILAIIQNESNFKPGAVGSAGEKGLMQVSEIAYQEVKRVYPEKVNNINYDNFNGVFDNIKIGVLYYKRCLNYYDGSARKALAAYNGGFKNPNYSYAEDVLEVRDQIKRF